jgi:hypothetical protein
MWLGVLAEVDSVFSLLIVFLLLLSLGPRPSRPLRHVSKSRVSRGGCAASSAPGKRKAEGFHLLESGLGSLSGPASALNVTVKKGSASLTPNLQEKQ